MALGRSWQSWSGEAKITGPKLQNAEHTKGLICSCSDTCFHWLDYIILYKELERVTSVFDPE